MKIKNKVKAETAEVELTEDALEQVSGGFNPQPDPPGKAFAFKYNQSISQPVLPGEKLAVQKVR